MRARANCRVSILRGSATNDYGDEVDTETQIYSGIPMSIIEQSRRTYLPAEQAFRVIRSYAGRCGPEVDLRKGDRVRNESSGRVYLVVDLGEPESAVMRPDTSFTLSRTT